MTTTILGTQAEKQEARKGYTWAILSIIVLLIAIAYVATSSRNNMTDTSNEGNNLSNTNSGYMDPNKK
jgi:hypothetical protein